MSDDLISTISTFPYIFYFHISKSSTQPFYILSTSSITLSSTLPLPFFHMCPLPLFFLSPRSHLHNFTPSCPLNLIFRPPPSTSCIPPLFTFSRHLSTYITSSRSASPTSSPVFHLPPYFISSLSTYPAFPSSTLSLSSFHRCPLLFLLPLSLPNSPLALFHLLTPPFLLLSSTSFFHLPLPFH